MRTYKEPDINDIKYQGIDRKKCSKCDDPPKPICTDFFQMTKRTLKRPDGMEIKVYRYFRGDCNKCRSKDKANGKTKKV